MSFFEWSKIFWAVFAPDDLFFTLLIAGAALTFIASNTRVPSRYRTVGLWMMRVAALSFAIFVILPIGPWTERPLENRFPRSAYPQRVDGMLVLGGGENTKLFASRGTAATTVLQGKLVAAAELARRYPQAKIVFSGGSGLVFPGQTSEAEIARAILAQMGTDPRRIIVEGRSRNTWENVQFSKALVHPKPGETWLLITPALHMPRTMGIANRVGWAMIAWPTDFLTPVSGVGLPPHDIIPNLAEFEGALRERVGLLAYRLTGKTDHLFPAPGDSVSDASAPNEK